MELNKSVAKAKPKAIFSIAEAMFPNEIIDVISTLE